MNNFPFESKFKDDPFASSFPEKNTFDAQRFTSKHLNNSRSNEDQMDNFSLRRNYFLQLHQKSNPRWTKQIQSVNKNDPRCLEINEVNNSKPMPNSFPQSMPMYKGNSDMEMHLINNNTFIKQPTKAPNFLKEHTPSIIIKSKSNEPLVLNEALNFFGKYGKIIKTETPRENQLKIVYSNSNEATNAKNQGYAEQDQNNLKYIIQYERPQFKQTIDKFQRLASPNFNSTSIKYLPEQSNSGNSESQQMKFQGSNISQFEIKRSEKKEAKKYQANQPIPFASRRGKKVYIKEEQNTEFILNNNDNQFIRETNPIMESFKTTNAQSESPFEIVETKPNLMTKDDKELLHGFINESKKVDLDEMEFIPECSKMCPEEEIKEREMNKDYDIFELYVDYESNINYPKINPNYAIKKFVRSAADTNKKVSSRVRTLLALKTSLDYMIENILDLDVWPGPKYVSRNEDGHNLSEIFLFILDRIRAIEQDIIVANYKRTDPIVIDIYEKSLRFYLIVMHQGSDISAIDFKLLLDQIRGLVTKLSECYQISLKLNKTECLINMAEFYAYFILLHILKPEDLNKYMKEIPKKVVSDKRIQSALAILSAYNVGNFIKLFRLIKAGPYLLSCSVLHCIPVFWQIILKILYSTKKGTSKNQFQKEDFENFVTNYMMNSEDELMEFATWCKLEIINDESNNTTQIILNDLDINLKVENRHKNANQFLLDNFCQTLLRRDLINCKDQAVMQIQNQQSDYGINGIKNFESLSNTICTKDNLPSQPNLAKKISAEKHKEPESFYKPNINCEKEEGKIIAILEERKSETILKPSQNTLIDNLQHLNEIANNFQGPIVKNSPKKQMDAKIQIKINLMGSSMLTLLPHRFHLCFEDESEMMIDFSLINSIYLLPKKSNVVLIILIFSQIFQEFFIPRTFLSIPTKVDEVNKIIKDQSTENKESKEKSILESKNSFKKLLAKSLNNFQIKLYDYIGDSKDYLPCKIKYKGRLGKGYVVNDMLISADFNVLLNVQGLNLNEVQYSKYNVYGHLHVDIIIPKLFIEIYNINLHKINSFNHPEFTDDDISRDRIRRKQSEIHNIMPLEKEKTLFPHYSNVKLNSLQKYKLNICFHILKHSLTENKTKVYNILLNYYSFDENHLKLLSLVNNNKIKHLEANFYKITKNQFSDNKKIREIKVKINCCQDTLRINSYEKLCNWAIVQLTGQDTCLSALRHEKIWIDQNQSTPRICLQYMGNCIVEKYNILLFMLTSNFDSDVERFEKEKVSDPCLIHYIIFILYDKSIEKQWTTYLKLININYKWKLIHIKPKGFKTITKLSKNSRLYSKLKFISTLIKIVGNIPPVQIVYQTVSDIIYQNPLFKYLITPNTENKIDLHSRIFNINMTSINLCISFFNKLTECCLEIISEGIKEFKRMIVEFLSTESKEVYYKYRLIFDSLSMSNLKEILLFKKFEVSFFDSIFEKLDIIKILVDYGSKELIFNDENSKYIKTLLCDAIGDEINEFSIFVFFHSIYLMKLGECFKGIDHLPICRDHYGEDQILNIVFQIYQEGKLLEQESNNKFKLFNSLKRLSPEQNFI